MLTIFCIFFFWSYTLYRHTVHTTYWVIYLFHLVYLYNQSIKHNWILNVITWRFWKINTYCVKIIFIANAILVYKLLLLLLYIYFFFFLLNVNLVRATRIFWYCNIVATKPKKLPTHLILCFFNLNCLIIKYITVIPYLSEKLIFKINSITSILYRLYSILYTTKV